MIKLLLNRIPKLIKAYGHIDIVITVQYIPVMPIEYISVDFVISEDIR